MPLRGSIITSDTAERMLERVSPIYDDSYVGLWMFEAIGREYDKLWEAINTLPAQLFPETVTWAIDLWERRYGLASVPTQTIEQRRQKVLEMRALPRPFTPASLERYIKTMTGRSVEVIDRISPYTFGINITDADGSATLDLTTLRRYIDAHKQSHMSYEILCQSAATINVKVETAHWVYGYMLCGTLPQENFTTTLEYPGVTALGCVYTR